MGGWVCRDFISCSRCAGPAFWIPEREGQRKLADRAGVSSSVGGLAGKFGSGGLEKAGGQHGKLPGRFSNRATLEDMVARKRMGRHRQLQSLHVLAVLFAQ